MMKFSKVLLAFFLLSQVSFSQKRWTADVKTVSKSGTYKIALPAKIVSGFENVHPKFRIYDAYNQEVAFVFKEEINIEVLNYNKFNIISRSNEPNKKSTIIFENTNPQLDFLTLEIANYSGEKTFVVLGSNDQKLWFGVLKPTVLSDLTGDFTEVHKELYLPKTNYKFLKIETIDKNSLPINILKIGQRILERNKINYFEISSKSIKINQSKISKKTLITVEFADIEKIDQLKFEITEPANYKRNVRLYEIINQRIKRKNQLVEVDFANFELTPNVNNNLEFPSKRTKKFFIEIDNKDNIPLEIKAIKFFQKPVIVLAALKANEKYTLKSEFENSAIAEYDTSEIDIIKTDDLPQTTVLNLKEIALNTAEPSAVNFWNSTAFFWLCIAIAAIVVLFFVQSFLKEIKKQSD